MKDDNKNTRRELRRKMKLLIWCGGVLAVISMIAYLAISAPRISPTEFESTTGIHWHTRVAIKINGENITIPNKIGLGVIHNPIHTHEEGDGTVHMEFEGRVRADDIRLEKFFAVWGKEWIATSFMGLPINNEHSLSMKVDGILSTEYGRLLMQDKQMIEIDYH
ncbi:MAG: hypothetical protein AAB869_02130 [Patescibacteria group bacterium]